jgi:hypothetical protein
VVTCARRVVVVAPLVELWRPAVAVGLVVAELEVELEVEPELEVDWLSAVVVVAAVSFVADLPGLVMTARYPNAPVAAALARAVPTVKVRSRPSARLRCVAVSRVAFCMPGVSRRQPFSSITWPRVARSPVPGNSATAACRPHRRYTGA